MNLKRTNPGLRNSQRLLALSCTIGLLALPARALNDQKIFALDGTTGDAFAIVDADSTTLAIGAPGSNPHGPSSGSVYLFEKDFQGDWTETDKLAPWDGGAGDAFGGSVSVFGDALLVGAASDDDRGTDAGAAYVYRQVGSSWYAEAKLTASNGVADDRFGNAVALDGDVAVIGAYHSGNGKAYVFRRQGSYWVQEAQLSSDFGLFGFSVAISGDRIAIGGYEAVAVYRHNGTSWQLEALLSSPGGPGAVFGISVALDGDRLVAGAWLDSQVAPNAGAAYVFRRQGTIWLFDAKLTAADGGPSNFFGGHVAVSGDRVLVGAHADDDLGQVSGSAYVFQDQGGSWIQEQKLLAPDGAPWDGFGGSVALTPETAFVGAGNADGVMADTGAVYTTDMAAPLPELFDLVPGRVTADEISPGTLEVEIDYSLLLGGDIQTSQLDFEVDVFVDGVHVATEPVTEYLALGIPACYSSAVPCVAGGCPGTVQCVWVDLPGSIADYCACDWIGSLIVQVPGSPGDEVEVVLDAADDVIEVREENNVSTVLAGDIGNNYCVSTPNSTGEAARITALGSAIVSDQDLRLGVRGLPSNAVNLFLMGGKERFNPFGDGYLCVGAPLMRIPPPSVANASGVALRSVDLTSPPWSDLIVPGSTWRFQNWYRDTGTAVGFNLSDATTVDFAMGSTLPMPSITDEPAFQDSNAHVVGELITRTQDMVGTQVFVRTAAHGRLLVQIEMIELFKNQDGFLELGYLEGPVVWGDDNLPGIVIDRLADSIEYGWTPLTDLVDFQTGLVGSNAHLTVNQAVFHRVLANEYTILTLGQLYGYDHYNQSEIAEAYDVLAGANCRSYWEWRCANTACSGNCVHSSPGGGGKAKITCECRSFGGCTWFYLPNCQRIACANSCELFGFWDFCSCK